MDNRKSNKKKNWLYYLRHLKIRNFKDKDNKSETGNVYCRKTSEKKYENCSFRRNLKKIHISIKICMHKNSSMSTDIPSTSIIFEDNATLAEISKNPEEKPKPEEFIGRVPSDEIFSLSMYYWYWGPLTVTEAEKKLENSPDGAFLIRDSSSTSYLFSISFRSVGKTLHSRIEYNRGRYSLYGQEGFKTVAELVENAIKMSENSVYCYSRLRAFPVRLITPISRYTQVRSLKFLCRFVIRQCTNINDIPKLPLPSVLNSYLQEGPYF